MRRFPRSKLATLRRLLCPGVIRSAQLWRRQLPSFTGSETLYRQLCGQRRPRDAHRAARGTSRFMPAAETEHRCEIIAAMKVRTTNRKGGHFSTVRILRQGWRRRADCRGWRQAAWPRRRSTGICAKPLKSVACGYLDPTRSRALMDEMRGAGLPS
jgi:hypothetical protein